MSRTHGRWRARARWRPQLGPRGRVQVQFSHGTAGQYADFRTRRLCLGGISRLGDATRLQMQKMLWRRIVLRRWQELLWGGEKSVIFT